MGEFTSFKYTSWCFVFVLFLRLHTKIPRRKEFLSQRFANHIIKTASPPDQNENDFK